jgi:esterase
MPKNENLMMAFVLLCRMASSLFFRQSGQGPALFVLHGVFGSGDNWLTVTKQLAEHFTVYLIDQRNHGRSFHSQDFSYPILCQDVVDFAQDQGVDSFHLIGHSMGGKVAMNLAVLHPGLLRKMVVVDIAPRYYTPHHQQIIAGFDAVQLATIQSRSEAEQQMAAFIDEPDVRQFLLKNLYRTETGSYDWRINLPILRKAVMEIGQGLPEGPPISVPTLFLKGGNSRYISAQDEVEIAQRFTHSMIETIAGAGHWLQAEKPVEFLETVMPFLLAP